jgi:hypothetical protein
MARSTYEPPADAAELFAQVKAAHDELRRLAGPLHEMAVREMQAGATIGDLEHLTGYRREKYRRWARAANVPRVRPPTRTRQTESD